MCISLALRDVHVHSNNCQSFVVWGLLWNKSHAFFMLRNVHKILWKVRGWQVVAKKSVPIHFTICFMSCDKLSTFNPDSVYYRFKPIAFIADCLSSWNKWNIYYWTTNTQLIYQSFSRSCNKNCLCHIRFYLNFIMYFYLN